MKNSEMSAAILAGGRSSRMGTNKALLTSDGKTFIEQIAKELLSVFNEVVIISDLKEQYEFLKLPVYEDIYKNRGPIAGIHSAMHHTKHENLFIASCDIPCINKDLIWYLLEARQEEAVTIFSVENVPQPLVGIYHSKILPIIEEKLQSYQLSVLKLISEVRSSVIPFPWSGEYPHGLVNVNTPEEYIQYCKR